MEVGCKVSYMLKKVSMSQTLPFCLSYYQDVELQLQHHISLCAARWHHDDNGLNTEDVSHPNEMVSFIRFPWSWCLFTTIEALTRTQLPRKRSCFIAHGAQ